MFKKLFILLSSLGFVACSNGGGGPAAPTPTVTPLGADNQEVELTVRGGFGSQDNYLTSTYSFFHLTRDDQGLTKNSWDILVSSGGSRIDDEFRTELVGGDFGIIADLGRGSCKSIRTKSRRHRQHPHRSDESIEDKRSLNPSAWFAKSDVYRALRRATADKATVRINHCYVIMKMSTDSKVIAVFHVKDHRPGRLVVLDEIEIFEKSIIQRVY